MSRQILCDRCGKPKIESGATNPAAPFNDPGEWVSVEVTQTGVFSREMDFCASCARVVIEVMQQLPAMDKK